jgi:hypothetical protein
VEKPLLDCSLKDRIQEALETILAFCADAYDARENACEGSAEWHKRTGEVLAYARMTSLLWGIEEASKSQNPKLYGSPN